MSTMKHPRETDHQRWLRWRSGTGKVAGPAPRGLFRVRTLDGSFVVSLSDEQLSSLGATTTTRHSPGDLMRRVEEAGELTVWEHAVRGHEEGDWHPVPARPLVLSARGLLRIEHHDGELPEAVSAMAA